MTDEPRNPDLRAEALAELRRLMDEAAHRGDRETHCAALATADADGRPSVRTVNIARVTPGGLLILVNAQTGKGRQMLANPRAALCFHWPALEQQAIVEGCVRMLSDAESDELWHIQPRENMLGHWASDQLSPAADSAAVKEKLRELRRRFDAERLPRPPGWRAFEIQPDRIDLWPTGWERLRPRLRYTRSADGRWSLSRQSP